MNRRLKWQPFAALGLIIGLLVLLSHPTVALGAQLVAFVLLPVLLFGLVMLPSFFWPAYDDQRFWSLILPRTDLFQRPPPFCKH
jgi:hypothetical protein